MNRRSLLIALCLVALMTGALAFGSITSGARSAKPSADGAPAAQVSSQPAAARAAAQQPANVPQHVVYGLLFREVAAFKKKADQMRDRGQDGSALRDFHKQRAKLSDQEAQVLDRVADDCMHALLPLDKQAQALIKADRARHPGGLLQQGEALPLPPAKLKALEQQRRETILNGRDQLRAAMGEAEFQRFDQFVHQDITDRIKPVPRPNASRR
jgi:hypothetical protein